MSVLALGQAFGRVPAQWAADSLALTPVVHDHARTNASHTHEAAFVTLMLGGEYVETTGLRSMRFARFDALYHPPAVEHRDVIGEPGVRLLMFEFRPDGYDVPRSIRDLSGSRVAWDILRLYRDAADGAEPLEFEARSLDLIAGVAALKTPRDLPAIVRARDYLHATFRERVTVTAAARAAGIHPVYLGQAFRREFGETLADYVARLRVRAAAEQLSTTDAPIAAIAYDHGFCDQSHFQRVFRKVCGMTPLQFRRAFSV